MTMTTALDNATRVLDDVYGEVYRQFDKWGDQSHPSGTGLWPSRFEEAQAKQANEIAVEEDRLTWELILREEFCEAAAETDPARLRTELVQVAAVAVSWISDLDRKAVA